MAAVNKRSLPDDIFICNKVYIVALVPGSNIYERISTICKVYVNKLHARALKLAKRTIQWKCVHVHVYLYAIARLPPYNTENGRRKTRQVCGTLPFVAFCENYVDLLFPMVSFLSQYIDLYKNRTHHDKIILGVNCAEPDACHVTHIF